ncbi:hypothetical protein ACQ9AA_08370 [Klebsiella pneumoniae]|uniref:hypothetical protein n=1 Tax=Klebsiella pneumoniae TaxID=573 RepID=UPI003F1CFB56
MAVTKMICVSSTTPAWFTPGAVYDSEPRGTDICICGDNLVSDLNKEDWYEMSQRADGLWFLIGFQQAILFRGANHISKGNKVFQSSFVYLNGNVFARFDLFYSYMV